MNSSNPPPRYDKEQHTATPFLVRRPLKKRRSLVKQLIAVGQQRPLFLLFLGLVGLGLVGWWVVSSLPNIGSTLHSLAQARAEVSPVSVVKTSPLPAPTKSVVVGLATPTATPVATPPATHTPSPTPLPTPKATPTPPEAKSVNVTAPASADKGRFAVQVGAYQDQAEAASNLARMKGQGLEARMIIVTLRNKGLWHRLQVGRFATRDAATRFGQQLQARKAISDFMVTEYPGK